MTDLDPEDTAAMRRENGGKDFRLFLRQQIAAGQARRTTPVAAKVPPPPSHRPGAWPVGTRPPDPLKPQPPGAWAAAVDRDRAGLGSQNDPCECGGCPPPTKETK